MNSFLKPLVVNLKNYPEIAGKMSIIFAKDAASAVNGSVNLILAPPVCSLQAVCDVASLPVISQHVDDVEYGATTGFIVPEYVKACGAVGSLLNHSEHKISSIKIKNLVRRLGTLNMISIVCAADIEEAIALSKYSPDYIAIEPPDLIGKGIAVSKADPSIIVKSVREIEKVSKKTRVLCGAGIVHKEDVTIALELGASGILVASGVVKASSWKAKIRDLCSAFNRS
jgi:triosephosphate isomerase